MEKSDLEKQILDLIKKYETEKSEQVMIVNYQVTRNEVLYYIRTIKTGDTNGKTED